MTVTTEQLVRDRINNDSSQPHNLGGRIRPNLRYAKDQMPAVVYNVLSEESQNNLAGSDGQVVKVECVALAHDYGMALDIAKRIRTLFDAHRDGTNNATTTVGVLDVDQLAPVDGSEAGPWAATVSIQVVRY
tara:strand:+ start:5709 stop:6104 length:396 start_codon:yes stop_codon:yes gene_type:complete